jgi:protease-4
VRDWRLTSRLSDLSFLHMAAAAALDAVGLTTQARRFTGTGSVQPLERLNVDGLLALWHPPGAN